MLEGKLEGRHSRGRPRMMWTGTITECSGFGRHRTGTTGGHPTQQWMESDDDDAMVDCYVGDRWRKAPTFMSNILV